MRIVFFGTPEFAATSLAALLESEHDVVGVVTQPDRPHGRSRSVLVAPPVKSLAERAGVPVLQPERPVGDVFMAALRRLDAEIGVVVAYGHILRPVVLAVPTRGMINVHASLLPRWRGAAPIPWAIAEGDCKTGVSVMQMTEGMDEGPVFLRVSTPIASDDTAGSLSRRLAELGGRAVLDVLETIETGATIPEPQDDRDATYAPKLHRGTARIDWTVDATTVANRIRAFEPAPGAWTELEGHPVKLFGAHRANGGDDEPGTLLPADGNLIVATGAGAVQIDQVQPAGRKRLAAAEWLRGHGALSGERFR